MSQESQNLAARDEQATPPPAPKPTDPLPGYSSRIGYVENYAPGIDPVLRWHPDALTWIREAAEPVTAAGVREALGTALDGVTDDDLNHLIVMFRVRRDLNARPVPNA